MRGFVEYILALVIIGMLMLGFWRPAEAQLPANAQHHRWLQFNLLDGSISGTNSKPANPVDLAALGHGQVEYRGPCDPLTLSVDVSQQAPVLVLPDGC